MFRIIRLGTAPLKRFYTIPPPTKEKRGFLSKLLLPPTVKQVEQLNLVSKDYKVVYICRKSKILNFGHATSISGSALLLVYFSGYFTDPEWMNRRTEMGLINPALGVLTGFYLFILNLVCLRTVRYIYRKDDKFKLVCYGYFGRFSKSVIKCKVMDVIPPILKVFPFYKLNGKHYVLYQSHFLDVKHFFELCKANLKNYKVQ